MTMVTIGVSSVDDTKARMRRAFDGEEQGAFIGFPSVALLWKVITPRRWEVLRAMAGESRKAVWRWNVVNTELCSSPVNQVKSPPRRRMTPWQLGTCCMISTALL